MLDRLDELVIKPVDGYGGGGVLIGPRREPDELEPSARPRSARDPSRWVAQELVALSTHPTFAGGGLEPRHVDLRAFVYSAATGPARPQLAGLALTRVAPPREHGRQLLARRRRQGHLDPDRCGSRRDGAMDGDERMCGIAGEIRFDGGRPTSPRSIARCAAWRPRARTAAGIWAAARSRSATAGCRSSTCRPPARSRWSTPSSGLTVVFNGCIYNYRELRDELDGRGLPLLLPLRHRGDRSRPTAGGAPRCVEHFLGHVRLRRRRARTAAGSCWPATGSASSRSTSTQTPERLRFASTLPALLAAGGVDTSIDRGRPAPTT